MPICTSCKVDKKPELFYKRKDRPIGRTSSCQECRKAVQKGAWVPKKNKDYRLQKTYGISLTEYEVMLEKQSHLCKICGQPERAKANTGKVKDLAVDHCHDTGKVRGLLCHRCNVALGQFDDDVSKLESAIKYLSEKL